MKFVDDDDDDDGDDDDGCGGDGGELHWCCLYLWCQINPSTQYNLNTALTRHTFTVADLEGDRAGFAPPSLARVNTLFKLYCVEGLIWHQRYTRQQFIIIIIIIIIINHEFHGDTSLKQNFRAAVNVTF